MSPRGRITRRPGRAARARRRGRRAPSGRRAAGGGETLGVETPGGGAPGGAGRGGSGPGGSGPGGPAPGRTPPGHTALRHTAPAHTTPAHTAPRGAASGESVRGDTGAKQALRERIWALLERRGVGRFPKPLTDRIPNFAGAELAATCAAELPEWKAARRLKCNPDAPQRPLRLRALREGKLVFVAVPRLAGEDCFLRLDPARLAGKLAQASTIKGAAALGEPVGPEALATIDLVVAGSVAVDRRGGRLGKGGGYSDLEFALARQVGAVSERTPVLTTVHDLQVVARAIPMTAHDVPVDIVVTPRRVIRTNRALPRPEGICWEELTEAQLAAMPILARLRPGSRGRRSAPVWTL